AAADTRRRARSGSRRGSPRARRSGVRCRGSAPSARSDLPPRGPREVANFTMFEYAGQMRRAARACRAAVVLAALSVTPATARERPPPHPADEIEVFSGAEEVAPGEAPKRPALAYWRVRATSRVPAT